MRPFLLIGFGLSLLLAVLVSPFASEHPDGLERVAGDYYFEERAIEVWQRAPMPDYAAPLAALAGRSALQTATAGGLGTLLVFAALFGAGRLVRTRRAPSTETVS